MLDQMFTAENFRRIYDAENRKGSDGKFLTWMQQASHLFSPPTITGLPPGATNSI
jgi:hypothetical protein